jgi:1,4-dihydroxy-2-naphthoyl-CoA synthase
MFLIDPKYIAVKASKKKHQSIIYDGYYINRLTSDGIPIYTAFHPKTIVYMVQYYSHSTKNYRYMVIVGKDINKDTITGYNYKASGLWVFINRHMQEFVEKRAYIYPVFWFMIDKMYTDVKMILIT